MYGTNWLQGKCMLRVGVCICVQMHLLTVMQIRFNAFKYNCTHKCILQSYSLYRHLPIRICTGLLT